MDRSLVWMLIFASWAVHVGKVRAPGPPVQPPQKDDTDGSSGGSGSYETDSSSELLDVVPPASKQGQPEAVATRAAAEQGQAAAPVDAQQQSVQPPLPPPPEGPEEAPHVEEHGGQAQATAAAGKTTMGSTNDDVEADSPEPPAKKMPIRPTAEQMEAAKEMAKSRARAAANIAKLAKQLQEARAKMEEHNDRRGSQAGPSGLVRGQQDQAGGTPDSIDAARSSGQANKMPPPPPPPVAGVPLPAGPPASVGIQNEAGEQQQSLPSNFPAEVEPPKEDKEESGGHLRPSSPQTSEGLGQGMQAAAEPHEGGAAGTASQTMPEEVLAAGVPAAAEQATAGDEGKQGKKRKRKKTRSTQEGAKAQQPPEQAPGRAQESETAGSQAQEEALDEGQDGADGHHPGEQPPKRKKARAGRADTVASRFPVGMRKQDRRPSTGSRDRCRETGPTCEEDSETHEWIPSTEYNQAKFNESVRKLWLYSPGVQINDLQRKVLQNILDSTEAAQQQAGWLRADARPTPREDTTWQQRASSSAGGPANFKQQKEPKVDLARAAIHTVSLLRYRQYKTGRDGTKLGWIQGKSPIKNREMAFLPWEEILKDVQLDQADGYTTDRFLDSIARPKDGYHRVELCVAYYQGAWHFYLAAYDKGEEVQAAKAPPEVRQYLEAYGAKDDGTAFPIDATKFFKLYEEEGNIQTTMAKMGYAKEHAAPEGRTDQPPRGDGPKQDEAQGGHKGKKKHSKDGKAKHKHSKKSKKAKKSTSSSSSATS